ncbi:DUF2796 domain-containing protein [Vandammella animalimorsus]|uniref:DUF2796 domain-containing protein n=1 Tax=Vandammella animalimorsus TaxID=2029117 RepID=A0A2A2AVP0_9BURK|nr:DUF2796 domain-containing protein [Vandammella animalimorsus]PAT41813.1 hypothetical protein CK621_12405 [Vandammella animalimorsus]
MQRFSSHRTVCAALLLSSCLLGAAHAHGKHDDHDHDDDHAQRPHVHGVAHLDVALEGKQLLLELTSPQADITGFEHEARSKQDKEALRKARQQLKQAASLFSPSAAAACELKKVDIDGLEHDHDHDHDDHPHGKKRDHDHDHDDKHEHADVEVSYRFDCARPEALEAIEVQLAKTFTSLHTIEVQLAMPQGQFQRTLKSGQTRLSWK